MKYYNNYEVRHVQSYIGQLKCVRHLFEIDVLYGFYHLYDGKKVRRPIAIYKPDQNVVDADWRCMRDFEVPIRRFASKHNARIIVEKRGVV